MKPLHVVHDGHGGGEGEDLVGRSEIHVGLGAIDVGAEAVPAMFSVRG